MKNLIFTLGLIALLAFECFGQDMIRIHKTDGTLSELPLADISQVEFSLLPPPFMEVNATDGINRVTFYLSEIDSITYFSQSADSTIKDADGNEYSSVVIGTQEWLVENLKTTKFIDGTPIPNVSDDEAWEDLDTLAGYCDYNNDPDISVIHGKLYNWYVIADSKGVCPEGWHVPTDEDWQVLEAFYGMTEADLTKTGLRGHLSGNVGGKLKSGSGWLPPNLGAGSQSKFMGLPGGYRNTDGSFWNQRGTGAWWTSTQSETNITRAFARLLSYDEDGVFRNLYQKRTGYSIRCLKN